MNAGSRLAVEWIGSKLEFGKVGSLRSEFLIMNGKNSPQMVLDGPYNMVIREVKDFYLEQYLNCLVRQSELVTASRGNR